MRFIKPDALNDGEILVEIAGAPDVAKGFREISERKPVDLNDTGRVGIKKGGAVKEAVGSCRRKGSVGIRLASTAALQRVVGRVVGT